MSKVIDINSLVATKIINIRGHKVIIDSDVAELYDVETKRINEAVRNNPDKFPDGYLMEPTDSEWISVRSKFSTSPLGGGRTYKSKLFTEKGLYMLATILKSPKAVETTLAIIDTFAKVRELNQVIASIQNITTDNPAKQKHLMQKTGELMSDLIFSNDNLEIEESETTLEVGFPFMRLKKIIKKGKA